MSKPKSKIDIDMLILSKTSLIKTDSYILTKLLDSDIYFYYEDIVGNFKLIVDLNQVVEMVTDNLCIGETIIFKLNDDLIHPEELYDNNNNLIENKKNTRFISSILSNSNYFTLDGSFKPFEVRNIFLKYNKLFKNMPRDKFLKFRINEEDYINN
jgi:hypothetical protein